VRTFKVSNAPHFAEKLEDIVGLSLNPPETDRRSVGLRRSRVRASEVPSQPVSARSDGL
jgi:hypothetical protein